MASTSVRLFALGLGLVLAGTSFGQISKNGDKYVLRYKFTKGATFKYQLNATSAGSMGGKPISQNTTIGISIKVKEVKGDNATLTVGATPQGGTAAQTQTVQTNTRGKLVGDSAATASNLGIFLYPDKAVKIGETWTSTSSAATQGMNVKTTATYKLTGFKTVGGKQLAIIVATGTASSIFSMNFTTTYLIGMSDGWLVSSTSKMTASLPSGDPKKPGKMTVSATMKRV